MSAEMLYDDTPERPETVMESFVVRDSEEISAPERLRTPGATIDPVKDYLRAIGRTPLLNAEEEIVIAKRVEAGLFAGKVLAARRKHQTHEALTPEEQQRFDRWFHKASDEELAWMSADGDEARDLMLEANLRLVVSIAKRYQGRGLEFLELIQEGNLGLVRGVEKFDYTKGYKFSTYATWWIKQNITRSLMDKGRSVRLPVHVMEDINKMWKAERALEKERGGDVTLEALAEELEMDVEKIIDMKEISQKIVSLDTPVGEDGDATLGDLFGDEQVASPAETAEFHLMREALGRLVESGAGLTEREATVIRMRFGLDDGTPKTLDEVGKVFDLTRERIRQIQRKAIERLKKQQDLLQDYLD